MAWSNRGFIASCVIIAVGICGTVYAADTASADRSAYTDWLGKNDFSVWKITRANGCSYPRLVNETPSTQTFQIICGSEQSRLIQCEFTNCKLSR